MKHIKKFETVREFVEFLDRKRFQDTLGHSAQVVTRAIRDNQMPAHWFIGVRGLCNEIGVMTPEHLFKWTHPEPSNKHFSKQNANYAGEVQGLAKKSFPKVNSSAG